MATLRCEECGAAARAESDRFCSFCGAKYAEPTAPAPPREAARAETRDRFARLEDHPRARAAMAARVSGAETVARHGAGALFAVVFVVMAGAMAMFMIGGANQVERGFEGVSAPGFPGGGSFGPQDGFFAAFKIVPLLVVGIGVIFAIRKMTQTAHVASSPTRASLVHVLDEHTETRGANDNVHTVHVVTLESSSGRRASHEVPRGVARSLTRGDMGVAHTKGGELVRFTRVDV